MRSSSSSGFWHHFCQLSFTHTHTYFMGTRQTSTSNLQAQRPGFYHKATKSHRNAYVLEDRCVLPRALNSIPLNTYGMNWNAECTQGLHIQHQCMTSLMHFLPTILDWQMPTAMLQNLVESPQRRVIIITVTKSVNRMFKKQAWCMYL